MARMRETFNGPLSHDAPRRPLDTEERRAPHAGLSGASMDAQTYPILPCLPPLSSGNRVLRAVDFSQAVFRRVLLIRQ